MAVRDESRTLPGFQAQEGEQSGAGLGVDMTTVVDMVHMRGLSAVQGLIPRRLIPRRLLKMPSGVY